MIQYSNIKAYNQVWSPMGRYPMIDNSQFETYQEALTFATTNAVAVVGSVITVTNDPDTTKRGVYELIYTGDAPLTKDTQPTGIKRVGADIDLSNYVTKDQITNVYKAKGSKTTFAELPVVDVTVGDVWNVEEAHDGYPSGTNWVWTGTEWDALAGIADLSAYALKADVDKSLETIEGNIAANTGAIGTINSALSNKVDAVTGYSLISEEKLQLIDASAGQIGQLVATDESFESRLKTLEGAFTGEGGTIDLGELTSQLTDHGTRITALETDNTNNKSAIAELQNADRGFTSQIEAIVELNTQQTGQITGLTTELGTVKNSVSGHTTEIATLNTAVGANTQAIGEIKNSINGLAVKSVKEGDLVLAADSNGVLNTTINLNHYKDESDGKTYVALTGIEGAIISRFDASDFVKDSFVDTVVYDPATKNMTITWNTESGKQPTVIPMSGLVDTYTAGTGLTVANNEFSVLLSANENNKLTVTNDGLLVDISEDLSALETKLNGNIASAFEWVNVE